MGSGSRKGTKEGWGSAAGVQATSSPAENSKAGSLLMAADSIRYTTVSRAAAEGSRPMWAPRVAAEGNSPPTLAAAGTGKGIPVENSRSDSTEDERRRQAGAGVASSTRPQWATSPTGRPGLVRRLQEQAPNSTQVIGFLTFVVSGAILLLLTGLTLTGAVMALIFFGPIILLSSPIWVPAVFVMFVAAVAVLSAGGLGVAALAGASWLFRYFMGRHPMGSDRVDYARSRIADTATHVKDYAREYSGYLKSRVKDAAPGA
ncbi:hypothetical protein BHM03_00003557 [Ensete ventricosum]|nr:hypothetical protein BHM03_00003557 [Ensete ventricosum]